MTKADLRRGILFPALFVLGALIALVSLGTWQIERKEWKETLIATIEDRLAAAPIALPPPNSWPTLSAENDEFRRVKFQATFDHGKESFVYTAGSSLRPDVSGVGYWVFTPARLSSGAVVMVNRGFVPEGKQDPATRREGQLAGMVEIVGALRWPEKAGFFTPEHSPTKNLFFLRDPAAMAISKVLNSVADFYIDQDSPPVPGGLPYAGKLHSSLSNNHFGYALTWYGLALVLLGVFSAWILTRKG